MDDPDPDREHLEALVTSGMQPPGETELAISRESPNKHALIIGINHYQHYKNLTFACPDATSVDQLLSSAVFGPFATDVVLDESARRAELRRRSQEFFRRRAFLLVFYFAGHGTGGSNGGTLVTHDGEPYDEGIPFDELARWVRASPAQYVLLILDCCHSGAADIRDGAPQERKLAPPDAMMSDFDRLGQGRVLLASCARDAKAREEAEKGHGIFTHYFLQACRGGAADDAGRINIMRVYSYIREMQKDQVPVFKGEIEGDLILAQVSAPDAVRNEKRGFRYLHPLPPAPRFEGRKAQLDELKKFVKDRVGILAVVGLGGVGKTALIERFLNDLRSGQVDVAGAFVWSFYEDKSTVYFLRELYRYVAEAQPSQSTGYELLYEVMDRLYLERPLILVVDGLEVMQRTESDRTGLFGEILDPLLKRFLTTLASSPSNVRCIITSRFELPDLEPWKGKDYRCINLGDLGPEDARALLRRHLPHAEPADLDRIIGEYGTHSLTLDFIGGYIAKYFGGDPRRMEELSEYDPESNIKAERKLAKILNAYRNALSPHELAILERICVFRFGLSFDELYKIFVESGEKKFSGPLIEMGRKELRAECLRLAGLHLITMGTDDRLVVHPVIKDFFYNSFTESYAAHDKAREYFSSLVGKPGAELPVDKKILDLLEELLYHSIQVGRDDDAANIYYNRLGGVRHLGWNLGEFDRGKRIVDTLLEEMRKKGRFVLTASRDMGIYLRALGDLAGAEECYPDDLFRGLLWILRGNLDSAFSIKEPFYDPIKRCIQHIRGSFIDEIEFVTANSLLMMTEPRYFLRFLDNQHVTLSRKEWIEKRWFDDVARADLILAELARLEGDLPKARIHGQDAKNWILPSGSQEHLCGLYHFFSKLVGSEDISAAIKFNKQAENIAVERRFSLYLIDILNQKAMLNCHGNDFQGALVSARAASDHADASQCRHAWGRAEALHLQGKALLAMGRQDEARLLLADALELRRRIRDEAIGSTRELIQSIRP